MIASPLLIPVQQAREYFNHRGDIKGMKASARFHDSQVDGANPGGLDRIRLRRAVQSISVSPFLEMRIRNRLRRERNVLPLAATWIRGLLRWLKSR